MPLLSFPCARAGSPLPATLSSPILSPRQCPSMYYDISRVVPHLLLFLLSWRRLHLLAPFILLPPRAGRSPSSGFSLCSTARPHQRPPRFSSRSCAATSTMRRAAHPAGAGRPRSAPRRSHSSTHRRHLPATCSTFGRPNQLRRVRRRSASANGEEEGVSNVIGNLFWV
jgi:hypothetical protein